MEIHLPPIRSDDMRPVRMVLFTQPLTDKISITSSNSKQHPEHKVLQTKQKQA